MTRPTFFPRTELLELLRLALDSLLPPCPGLTLILDRWERVQ